MPGDLLGPHKKVEDLINVPTSSMEGDYGSIWRFSRAVVIGSHRCGDASRSYAVCTAKASNPRQGGNEMKVRIEPMVVVRHDTTETAVRLETLEEVRQKIESGFYDRPEIDETLGDLMLDLFLE